MFYSPLRYPGGKNKLAAFIAKICLENSVDGHYVEPYSGGGSVALFLLFEGIVDKITLNDKDRSIYAFWYSVLYETDSLCSLIENTEITLIERQKQKLVQKNKENADLLALGFSTFFLNRTNRSGILNAGVIGGISQNGKYLMDCRFNKEALIGRIHAIASHRAMIDVFQMDAVDLIDKITESEISPDDVMFYFDPPYYLKASSLYMNYYKEENHKEVSDKIKSIKNMRWIVSYDNVPQIRSLYDECFRKEFSFKHVAYESRVGKEILFLSDNIKRPDILDWNPLLFKMNRKNLLIEYCEK